MQKQNKIHPYKTRKTRDLKNKHTRFNISHKNRSGVFESSKQGKISKVERMLEMILPTGRRKKILTVND